ncbi:MAG: GAF domain-containing protein [Nakamurella sp.]
MADSVCAVRKETDLRSHAHLLQRTHEAMIVGSALPVRPRDVVDRSWRRMRAADHDVERIGRIEQATADAIERRRRTSPMAPVIDGLRQNLAAVAEEAQHLMVVSDADGMILWRAGSAKVRRRADAVGFADGALWTESTVGTNAIGTAMVEQAPVQLFSAEHFSRSLHTWTCTASPVHDPRTGDLIGIVNLSGDVASAHPATVALVATAVRLAEADLWIQREVRLNQLRQIAGSVLSRVRGPAMLVDDDGWVAAVNGIATTGRVAVPSDQTPCFVPGLGACLPEAITGGWLLRPQSATSTAGGIRLHIDYDVQPVEAVVEGDTTWRYPLTPRSVQLLALLMNAGRAGISTLGLSEAMFGDQHHEVTVRAEVSRLRRKLGGLVLTRPYRIAPNIVVDGDIPSAGTTSS